MVDIITLGAAKSSSKSYTDAAIDRALTSVYKFKGQCTNAQLLNKTKTNGDVWEITDDGTFAKGTDVVCDNGTWRAMAGQIHIEVVNNLTSTSTMDALSANMGKYLNDTLNTKVDTAGTGLSKTGTTLNHSATIIADTTSTATPTVGGTISYVDSVTRDSTGHVTTINVKTATLPAELPTASSSDADKVLYVDSNGDPAWGHKITISASNPSGGSDGDIWLKYE